MEGEEEAMKWRKEEMFVGFCGLLWAFVGAPIVKEGRKRARNKISCNTF